jgi:hypothetical protein
MKRKVEIIAERITEAVKDWPSVDTIALGEPIGDDMYDPYFFMSIDVYHTGTVPPVEKRMEYFSFGGAFESAQANKKDRFIAQDIAVRIEYKELDRVEELIEGREGLLASLRDSGTYGFYRLLNSEIMFNRTDWIFRMRGALQNMPQSFWNLLRYSFQARMEHYLSDLGAAAVRNDPLFYLVSASGFIRSVCSVLFAINRQYEPSVRLLSEQVKTLPVLPEPFLGRYESFLRNDPDLLPDRKREIAELLAKSIINL